MFLKQFVASGPQGYAGARSGLWGVSLKDGTREYLACFPFSSPISACLF